MKILLGMPARDSWGGPAASEPPFADALRKSGVETAEETYVYSDKEKPTPIFERIRRVVKTALRFRRILQRESFDLIHLNTAFDLKTLLRDSTSLFLMPKTGAKIFLKIHGTDIKYLIDRNLLVSFLRNYLRRNVDGFGLFTIEEREAFIRAGFAENKLFRIKNPIVPDENLSLCSVRQKENTDHVFRLLFVSRFVSTKGLTETIRACRILKEKNYKFVLRCVGDGEIRSAAERETKNLDLSSDVYFTGYISESEVTKYFIDSDIFVFPTNHTEGFPMVLFKAAAAGLPIVTTRVRAANDYLSEPENCLFCTQEPENISQNIINLIEDKKLRETMCVNNRELGKTLSPENIAEEYLDAYRKIIGQ